MRIEFGRLRPPPNVEIWDKTIEVISDFFRRTLPHHDIVHGACTAILFTIGPNEQRT